MGKKWWWVYDSNVGRQSQRIYSPPQLATLVTHRTENAAHYRTSRKKKQPQKCKHPQKNQKHSRPYSTSTSPTPTPQSRPRSHATSPTFKTTPRHLCKKCRHLCTSASLITTEIPTRLYNECRPLRGLTPPPHPHVNAERLIPNNALAGIKSNGNCFMKQSRLRLENDARMLSCGGFALWGCSPHKANPPHSKTSAPVFQIF